MAKQSRKKSIKHTRRTRTLKGGIEPLSDLDISIIEDDDDDEHELNIEDAPLNAKPLNISTNLNETVISETNENPNNLTISTLEPLNLSDLNTSNISSTNTTKEEISFGGRKRKTMKGRKSMKKRKIMRKRKTMRKRNYIRKNNRKQHGGTCYGNGVGANSYDPNFTIYNTRELQLFPYKPTN